MRTKYLLNLAMLCLISGVNAQTTFDWESNAVENIDNVQQTEDGITVTFTIGTNNPHLYDAGGFAGSNGFVVVSGSNDNTNATFTFSEPVSITSIYAAEITNAVPNSADWTFVPTGGSNSTVVATIPEYGGGGITVDLNWVNVTQFEVTSSESTVSFLFDDLICMGSANTSELTLPNSAINVFPNPSNDFITISGIETQESFELIDLTGKVIQQGTVNNGEKINITQLKSGLYLLKTKYGTPIKFQKK